MLSTPIGTDDSDQSRTDEQQKFLEMWWQICSLRTSRSLPRNPVSELKNLFATWQERRYMASDEMPHPTYAISTKDGRLVMEQERVLHEGITEWAVRHNLVSPEGLVPNWILNWAEYQFFKSTGELRPLRDSIPHREGTPSLAIGRPIPAEPAFRRSPRKDGETARSYHARQTREFKQWHIATRFGTSTGALQRHGAGHLLPSVAKAHAAAEIARADNLLDEIRAGSEQADRLWHHAETLLKQALESKDSKLAIGALDVAVKVRREVRDHQKFRAEISGELDKPPAQQSPLGVGPGGQAMILSFPKTPEASAIERERLERNGYLKPQAALPAPVADPGPVEPK
jgi:hypothetical protein